MSSFNSLKDNIGGLNTHYNAAKYEMKKSLIIDRKTVEEEKLNSLNKNNSRYISEINEIERAIRKREEEKRRSSYYFYY